jgi:spore coat protein A
VLSLQGQGTEFDLINSQSAEAVRVGEPKIVKAILNPDTQPKFVNGLPTPPLLDTEAGGSYHIDIRQDRQWLGLVDANGNRLYTTIWGYALPGVQPTMPGPTILASSNTPADITWKNLLPKDSELLPVDLSIAEPDVAKAIISGYSPTVTHLHGGHTDAISDGHPDAWFTNHNAQTGPFFVSDTDHYDNSQQAATLWYHDHTDTITRLNMYAGLSGFYNLRDGNERTLQACGVLPTGSYEINAALTDRSFTTDGQLYLPGAKPDDPIPGPGGQTVADILGPDFQGTYPTIVPEFFGDTLLVNGMAWPKRDVQPTQYRLNLLDSSDSRFYVLKFDNPWVKVTLVGNDGGLLPTAKTIISGDGVNHPDQFLVMGPADREDIVVDLSDPHLLGQKVTLLNEGPAYDPFQGIAPDGTLANDIQAATPADSVGQVMQFDVTGTPADHLPTASVTDGTPLNKNYVDRSSVMPDHVRKLGLFEVQDAVGHVTPELGVAEDTTDINGTAIPFGPLPFSAPATETPLEGSTEEWDICNFTEDAHPIHIHLTQFQVLGRQQISFIDKDNNGIPDNVRDGPTVTAGSDPSLNDVVTGDSIPLRPEDLGRQDTVIIPPGTMVRLLATFDKPGDYVWHCHILSHEDNSMMRPLAVMPPSQTV